MRDEQWISEVLGDLRDRGLERKLVVYPRGGGKTEMFGRTYLNFSCNDYLNLSKDPRVIAEARRQLEVSGTSSSASRLVTGTLPIHVELEAALKQFTGCESAVIFGSGYLANIGVLSTLLGRNDFAVVDRLVHATIVDGAVLGRASLHRFRHNDLEHLEETLAGIKRSRKAGSKVVVVTESVFSMDGDLAPLGEISELAEHYDALLVVDEAHALGVFGPNGRGLVAELGLQSKVAAVTGAMGKALGSYGGFAACSALLSELLINRSRPFMYSTSLPPSVVGATQASLRILKEEPGLGAELLRRAKLFRDSCQTFGVPLSGSSSQIVPLIVGENGKAQRFTDALRQKGVLGIAIRSPTVPDGTARIRFSVTLAHADSDIREAAQAISETVLEAGLVQ